MVGKPLVTISTTLNDTPSYNWKSLLKDYTVSNVLFNSVANVLTNDYYYRVVSIFVAAVGVGDLIVNLIWTLEFYYSFRKF